MKINIIGDIAGRFDELMLLLDKMPEADLILSVGDMVDRGSQTPEVLRWFMKTDNAEALYGNHEDLMVNGVEYGTKDINNWMMWIQNGGKATLKSYSNSNKPNEAVSDIPVEVIEWLKERPMYFELDDLIVSHAPITSLKDIPKDPHGRDYFFIWNRWVPSKPQDKYMIHGHNGQLRRYKQEDGSEFGMCIDNSHRGVLTGIHWPSREIFEQEFLPEDSTFEERAEAEQRELRDDEKRAIKVLSNYKDY